MQTKQGRCQCSECWPQGYPPGEPRVSHERWQAANHGDSEFAPLSSAWEAVSER